MFGWVKSTLRKSEAALLVQQALEARMEYCPRPFNPDKLSSALVAKVWDHKPDIFDGKLGKAPHKMSVAAIALASGLYDYDHDEDMRLPIQLALGIVLTEVVNNGRFYNLSGADHYLLELADKACSEVAKRDLGDQGAVLGSLGL